MWIGLSPHGFGHYDARRVRRIGQVAGEVSVSTEPHRVARDTAAAPDGVEQLLVPGRSCGTCSLCCKVYSIKEIAKPAGRWCVHRARGVGCSIHASRPRSCSDFFCSWLVDPNLGPEWKPEIARFVLSSDATHRAIVVTVDPGQPRAWKREPYYAMLKKFAQVFVRIDQKVLVNLNGETTVVLPDRDVPIGRVGPGDEIVVWRELAAYNAQLTRAAGPVDAQAKSPEAKNLALGSM